MSEDRSDEIWFASIPLFGHLGPLLHQASELTRRGWRVAVISTEEARASLATRPELHFVSVGGLEHDPAAGRRMIAEVTAEPDFARGMRRIIGALNLTWEPLFDGLRDLLAAALPRLLVIDLGSMGAIDAADAAGLPTVLNTADLLPVLPPGLLPPAADVPDLFSGRSVHRLGRFHRGSASLRHSAATTLVGATVGRTYNRLRASRGLAPADFNARFRDRLILVNSAFGLEYPRPLPPLIQMVGPMLPAAAPLPPELERWLADGPPVVVVSLGTIALPSPDLLGRIAEGLRSDRWRALWAIRGEQRDALGAVPANVRIEPWLEMPGVLAHPNVRAFLSHCGTNSVQESLMAGTPIVGIPLFGVQGDMAVRIADAGVGVHLPKHRCTPAEITRAINQVIDGERFRRNIPAIQASIRLSGGVSRAADLIESAATQGVGHLTAGWGAA